MAATGRTRNARLPSRLCIRPVVVAPPASIGKKDWASFASPKTGSRPAPTRAETVTVIRQTATASETAPRPTAAEVTDDIAPDELTARTAMYNRMINAPTSMVGHDDLEMYERAQEGLMADGLEWVNIQRLYEDGEDFAEEAVLNGTTERQMRNQFDAWKRFMLGGAA